MMISKKITRQIKSSRFVQYCARQFFEYIYKSDLAKEGGFVERQQRFFLDSYVPGLKKTLYRECYGFTLKAESFLSNYSQWKSQVGLRNHDTMSDLMLLENGTRVNDHIHQKRRYALSGGTTQPAKKNKKSIYLPYEVDVLNDHAFHSICASFVVNYPSKDFFAFEFLPLGGSIREETATTISGDVSALLMKSKAGVTETLMYPYSVDVLTQSREKKYTLFLETIHTKNIGVIMGTTKRVAMMLDEIYTKYPDRRKVLAETLHGVLWGGVDITPYRHVFEKLGIKNLMGIYNAAEGVIGYQDLSLTSGVWYQFSETGFFEFIPRSCILDANIYNKNLPCFWIGELTEELFITYGHDFLLVYSTPGQIRSIMDVLYLNFIDGRLRFQIIGRVGGFINLVGEELSEIQAKIAIQQLGKKLGCVIEQWTVAPSNDKKRQYHEWVLESDGEKNEEMVVSLLDIYLQQINGDYADKRSCGWLQLPIVHLVSRGTFDRFHMSQGKVGGQTKCLYMSGGREYLEGILKVNCMSTG